jgi:hypothetical protein
MHRRSTAIVASGQPVPTAITNTRIRRRNNGSGVGGTTLMAPLNSNKNAVRLENVRQEQRKTRDDWVPRAVYWRKRNT